MIRFSVQLFGLTVFAIALIWVVGTGEAVQTATAGDAVLWADTTHFDVSTPASEKKIEKKKNTRDSFLRDVRKLTQTAYNIRNRYMEEVDTEEIIKSGIKGMLSSLDRYSVLMEPVAYNSLMESTDGKYEGLGMQIDARENHIIIVAPIEGTPAYRKGLRAGDSIWKINDKSTKGMSTSDASKLMRGKAGTSVTLTIKRAGIDDLLEFDVERAVIALKSVNYSGIVPKTNIGYVRLSRFAKETSHELREAINALNDKNIDGLIFDLRSNGGGLLDQAIETAELFLPEGSEVVYTKGQFENTESHHYSSRPPIYPDKPLIILVDEGTASASEIVSGAIQDWDRGLIIGNNTYGKGLVQTIIDIDNDREYHLKLTIAKYYVPSGRCIQKPEKQGKINSDSYTAMHDAKKDEDSDSLKISEQPIFYTNGGRIVYGGGGIVPDVEVDRELWKPIEINLTRKSLFFDFAIQYVADHPNVKPTLEITDDIVEQFRTFIKKKDFDYKTALQVALENFEEQVKEDSSESTFEPSIKKMQKLISAEKVNDFDESIDYIKRTIKREIVSSIAGERGVYEQVILPTDKTVQRAVEIIQSGSEYSTMLSKGMKKAEL